MTIVPVPSERVGVAYSGVIAGLPIQGVQWEGAASLLNWLVGRGRALIPYHRPQMPGMPGGAATPRFVQCPAWLEFSYQTIDWIAVAQIRASTSAPIVDSGRFLVTTPGSRRAAYSSAGVAATLDIRGPSASAWTIEKLGAYELSRTDIETTLLAGGTTGLETISGLPIRWETVQEQIRDQGQRIIHGRRVLWQRTLPTASPDQPEINLPSQAGFGVGVTSSTFVDVTPGMPSVARSLTGAATASCRGRAWTIHTGGSAVGELRFVSAAGNGSVVATQAGGAWTTESTVSVRTESAGTADGIPGAGIDFVRVQCRRVSGTGTVRVQASTLYEASS